MFHVLHESPIFCYAHEEQMKISTNVHGFKYVVKVGVVWSYDNKYTKVGHIELGQNSFEV